MSDAMLASIRVSSNLWVKYVGMVSNPQKAFEYARIGSGIAAEVAKLAIMPNDSPTRFKGKPGTTKRVAWSEPISLPEVKAVGKVLGCSVNDLLLSAAAGALRAYLVDQGDLADGVEIRAMVPVNLRRPKDMGKLGNRFGLVALELPVGIANPLARLYVTRERMEKLKGSYQAPLTLSILGAVGMAPKLAQEKVLDLLASKATAVMTNVPGPQEAIYLAGARLREPLFWVPQSGDIGMGVSILSYDNKVQFGLITDKKLVPDPEHIVDRFASEFDKLLTLVLMEPWERLADPMAVEAALESD
jgi:WS/DGAT/MGAT family acyltransferase